MVSWTLIVSFTVHAQLFLVSGLCVYKCVCIVIALVLSTCDCQLLCVGLRSLSRSLPLARELRGRETNAHLQV